MRKILSDARMEPYVYRDAQFTMCVSKLLTKMNEQQKQSEKDNSTQQVSTKEPCLINKTEVKRRFIQLVRDNHYYWDKMVGDKTRLSKKTMDEITADFDSYLRRRAEKVQRKGMTL